MFGDHPARHLVGRAAVASVAGACLSMSRDETEHRWLCIVTAHPTSMCLTMGADFDAAARSD